MSPLEILHQIVSITDPETGEKLAIELSPGLTRQEIIAFEAQLPCPLPNGMRELLACTRGFTGGGPIEHVSFVGEEMFEHEAFPHGLPFAADGFGNFWVVDLMPDSKDWGPIYFACHDAPVILYQGPTIEHFLTELLKSLSPPFKSLIDDAHEDRLFNVWRTNPGVLSHAECLTSSDPEIREFASQLDPTFQIIDLRNAPVGSGFSWGRYGADTVVRRYGALPIFAYQIRGFWGRWFGRWKSKK